MGEDISQVLGSSHEIDRGFTTQVSKEGHKITVSGSGAGITSWIVSGICSLIVVPPTFSLGVGSGIISLIIVLAAFMNLMSRSGSQSVIVTPYTINKEGIDYQIAEIRELSIINDNQTVSSFQPSGRNQTFVVYGGAGLVGTSAIGAAYLSNTLSQMSRAAGYAARESMSKREYQIRFRYGSKPVVLFKNLDLDKAQAVLEGLIELINVSIENEGVNP